MKIQLRTIINEPFFLKQRNKKCHFKTRAQLSVAEFFFRQSVFFPRRFFFPQQTFGYQRNTKGFDCRIDGHQKCEQLNGIIPDADQMLQKSRKADYGNAKIQSRRDTFSFWRADMNQAPTLIIRRENNS